MNHQNKKCLFCQGDNDECDNNCQHCGMALPHKHPQDKGSTISFFKKAFWGIVVFCVIMMFFLPR